MNMMQNKIVSVAFPMVLPGVYDYEIPHALAQTLICGMPVLVELRARKLWGVAVALKPSSDFAKLKKVLEVKSDRWTDADSSLVRLYEWIASYYHCDLGRVFRPLIRKSLIASTAKQIPVYSVSATASLLPLTEKQKAALDKLVSYTGELTAQVCGRDLGISVHLLDALRVKGAIVKSKKTVSRQPIALVVAETRAGYGDTAVLTDEQVAAVARIAENFGKPSAPQLLHGITGSGKTHVYIELVRQVLAAGKSAIVLVPEISLTPQTIYRFRQAVGDVIAVIHSRMSEGERHDSFAELVSGKRRCVIGVRSAILAPVVGLGLIIVDEEHDASYKQSDTDPRYNARDVAVMRGHFQQAVVVLGSATPSLESYYNAQTGKYGLITLSQRFGKAMLPKVTVIDICKEHEENNWTLLSQYLRERMAAVLENGRQIILLLNRRGFSTFLICKDCGHVYLCPSCSVNLTFHKSEYRLKCHQCGYEESAPSACPKCKGTQIKFKGTGIQKAEEYIKEQFPEARILRMDQDSTRGKSGHVDIIDKFENREADILLGTQMVSKGLNFPGVALVGVLAADIGLHIPDFRASERTFQLLSQVSGRAGRADADGEVVIQSYLPQDAAITAASSHDYVQFYKSEISGRQQLGYPPFGKLMRVLAMGENETTVQLYVAGVAKAIHKHAAGSSLTVLGPAPAIWSKLSNNFRYCLLLKSPSPKELSDIATKIRKFAPAPKGVRVMIDVDPVNML